MGSEHTPRRNRTDVEQTVDRSCSFCVSLGITCWLLEQARLHEGNLYHLSPGQIRVCTHLAEFAASTPSLDINTQQAVESRLAQSTEEIESATQLSQQLSAEPVIILTSSNSLYPSDIFTRPESTPTTLDEPLKRTTREPKKTRPQRKDTKGANNSTENTQKNTNGRRRGRPAKPFPTHVEEHQPLPDPVVVTRKEKNNPISPTLEAHLEKTKIPRKYWAIFESVVSGTKEEAWKKLIEFGKSSEEIKNPVDLRERVFSREFKNQVALFIAMLQYLVETHTTLTLEEYFEQYPARGNHLVIPE